MLVVGFDRIRSSDLANCIPIPTLARVRLRCNSICCELHPDYGVRRIRYYCLSSVIYLGSVQNSVLVSVALEQISDSAHPTVFPLSSPNSYMGFNTGIVVLPDTSSMNYVLDRSWLHINHAVVSDFDALSSVSSRCITLSLQTSQFRSPDSFYIPGVPIVLPCLHPRSQLSMQDYLLLPQVDRLALAGNVAAPYFSFKMIDLVLLLCE